MPTPQSAILPEGGPNGLFLILHLKHEAGADDALRTLASGFEARLAQTAAVDPAAGLVATLAFGAECWRRLSATAPRGLRPFVAVGSGALKAPATGGDLLLHLTGARVDLLYRFARGVVEALRPWIERAEETRGFRYLDCRDLTDFIDGTENPEGEEREEAALIGEEDAEFAGGSYMITQRYVHKLAQWGRLSDTEQEGVIGRTKPDSVELDDEVKPPTAHISRVVIEEHGEELEILRHSMPYGEASGEAGLFFIAYSRDRATFDKMLGRMFGTTADGLHDRLMEFTTPVSGGYFFAPSKEVLARL
ncbi:Dyp-type peroxidase [Endothiovibrio diazotrophicus]